MFTDRGIVLRCRVIGRGNCCVNAAAIRRDSRIVVRFEERCEARRVRVRVAHVQRNAKRVAPMIDSIRFCAWRAAHFEFGAESLVRV